MILQNINKLPPLFLPFFFFYLPLAATIILDFSLRLTHTFCYSSPLPTDFLSFSLYLSRSSLSLHLYSFLRIPVPSFRRAIHTSILPLHAHAVPLSLSVSLTFLLFTFIPTSLRPLLSFSHATLSRPCATLPLRSSFSPTLCSSFSVSFSHTSHSSLHVSCSLSLVCSISSLSRSPFIPHGCPSLSRSLALFLCATRSEGALPSPLAPLNYDRLASFISCGVPTSFSSSSSSSAPSASSVSLFFSLFLSSSSHLA